MSELLLDASIYFATAATALATALIVGVLIRGPGTIDRAIALDMLGLLLVAFAGIAAVHAGHAALLDIAIALALIGFLAAVAVARMVEAHATRGGGDD